MSDERLKRFQDAAKVYENGQRGDAAATSGMFVSFLLVYFLIRWKPPYPVVEIVVCAGSALLFWRLRRGPVTRDRLMQISGVGFVAATLLGFYWTWLAVLGEIEYRDWWLVSLMECGLFVGVGIYAWWAAGHVAKSPSVGHEEYQAVKAEVERAELSRPTDADATTHTFWQSSKVWFVRPIDQFACIVRMNLFRGKTEFEKVAVVPVTAPAIRAKLIELGGAQAVAVVEKKLGWPEN